MIWGNLIHLSYNFWEEADVAMPPAPEAYRRRVINLRKARPFLRFDDKLWSDLLARMAADGMNMVVLDLGDAVRYESHPEIAVRGAWSTKRLRRELDRMRRLGLEPIPKLNFSTGHDEWLGPYARCVSTDAYYAVCRDLIAEVAALFDRPKLFHLGMDEEDARSQRSYNYITIRQGDLWWHDFYLLQEQVERCGSRPWVWSDYIWAHRREFLRKMPRSVMQSNWYYGEPFRKSIRYVEAYLDLEAHGYDQIPTASNWSSDKNFANTVRFCRTHISPHHLKGFLQTPWLPTLPAHRRHHRRAIELVAKARAAFDAAPKKS
jgi:hypothetical protein